MIFDNDPVAALILDKAVRVFGSFIDNEVQRFANASVEEPGKKGKQRTPTRKETGAYAEALITGRLEERTQSLREFGKKRTGALVQGPDGKIKPA